MAFDGLAVQIRRRASHRELADFESDFLVLARLLPNVVVLYSHLARPPFTSKDNGSGSGGAAKRVADLMRRLKERGDEDDDYKVEADGDENGDEEDHIEDDDYRMQPKRRRTQAVDNKEKASHLRDDEES